jgi:hypothetical protein
MLSPRSDAQKIITQDGTHAQQWPNHAARLGEGPMTAGPGTASAPPH